MNKMWQHNTQSLVADVWSDNNLVKTLSNYHQPQLIAAGMMRRKIGDNDIREKDATPVDAPIQNVTIPIPTIRLMINPTR